MRIKYERPTAALCKRFDLMGRWLRGWIVPAFLAFASVATAQTAQTITFAPLSNKVYGNAPFTVSGTATSGLAVTFSSLTAAVCTVSGTTVTIVAAGACTIRASQAGNATYAPAPNVDRPFTVIKANQTITFAALAGKTYGNAPFTVSATSSSGLVVAFSSQTTTVCTVSGTTVTIVAAGACTIRASQAGNGNYNAATDVDRQFTVAKASQAITFAALAGKTYGNPPFTVTATASSRLVVAFASTTTAVCTVSANTVTIVGGGTCTIQASQAGNANYNAAPNVNQSFTVAKAAQTITFAALVGKTFGDPPFTISGTASSGLAVSFSSTTSAVCTVSGTTVTMIAGGNCTVRASQAGNGNYLAAANVDRTFVVAKAAQSITFNPPPGRTYGDAPFALVATATSGLTVAFTSLTATVCTVSGVNATLVAAGTCTIRASQTGNASYLAAATVTQSFTVAQKAQTIAFGALANMEWGSPDFAVTAAATSGLAVTFVSLDVSYCDVAGNMVTLLSPGVCTIQAQQAGNANYTPASPVSRSFTIMAAQEIYMPQLPDVPVNATPKPIVAVAGSGLPVTLTSMTSATCTVVTGTLKPLSLGTCTIRATQAGDAIWHPAPMVEQSCNITAAVWTVEYTYDAVGNVVGARMIAP